MAARFIAEGVTHAVLGEILMGVESWLVNVDKGSLLGLSYEKSFVC